MNDKLTHTWSKGLDYDSEVERLQALVAAHNGKPKGYFAILLTQLVQSLRISEAVDALMKWAKAKKNTDLVQIRVRKRKDVYWRDVYIPKSILDNSRSIKRILNKFEFSDNLVGRVRKFASYHLYNSHALRHAGITKQGDMGIPDQVIAVGTGHKKVEHIRIYTQREAARKVLKEMSIRA
ncbi:MAG: hypothetical protein V3U54_13505 [Thermodesulfobacteriota bacterium]